MVQKEKKILILDANSILYRAFHALPPLSTKKGEMVNAVYGFLLVFLKIIRQFQPFFVCACFDFPAPTFRHKQFEKYKANRPPTPQNLLPQIPRMKEVLSAFSVPIFEKEGFEADDLIGTISQRIRKEEKIIVSGDKDILQLIDSKTKIFLLGKRVKEIILYDEESFKEKYQGLNPNQFLDLKALIGDVSDNISGIKGIGQKRALLLLKDFNSLENLYKEIEKGTEKAEKLNSKLRILLKENREKIFFNKKFMEIFKEVPLEFSLENCRWGNFDKKKVTAILKKLEFYSLLKRIEKENNHQPEKGENLKLF